MARITLRAIGLAALFGCAACSEAGTTLGDGAQVQATHPLAVHSNKDVSKVRASVVRTVRPTLAAAPLVQAARKRLEANVVYDPRYVGISYPNGDVPEAMGVCTDVIIRSLRAAYGFDLQQVVHEDMAANFSAYPAIWGHTKTDKNIDHRRVPNLEIYFYRMDQALPITTRSEDYKPGDLVSWRLDGNTGTGGPAHIGIVSDRLGVTGTPLIIHNIGGGVEESDMLFDHQITGHFRLRPETKI